MSDSNSDGPPIGQLRVPQLTGVKITKKAAFGSELVAPPPKAPRPAVARVVTSVVAPAPMIPSASAPVTPSAPAPVVASAPALDETLAPVLDEAPAPVVAPVVAPTPVLDETPDLAPAPALTIAEMAAPAPTPLEGVFTRQEFFGAKISNKLQDMIIKASPVEVTPTIYRPITSPAFSDFMIQTYAQYSPMLQKIMREGPAAVTAEKTLDKDACKRRDPNKVENFYYQKLVRDYLQRNSPYRGLLIYHGLGSGKTCTSIAAAEALFWGGLKKIFVLTPATLSNNYRKELGKCGYFPLRTNNHWTFLPVTGGIESFWLENVLGLPAAYIKKVGGGWVPEPDKASNWEALSKDQQAAIDSQQTAHLNHRFHFIHYNGVVPEILSQIAADGVREGKSIFDEAVVIIDEVHNLVRTINGTQIGSRPFYNFMESQEPREPTWSTPEAARRPGFRYPRGYSLYRLLQNAVGCKIIALSATPMINYAQELAILINIIGGEQRTAEIPLRGVPPSKLKELEEWAQRHPTIDFYAIEENDRRESILTVSPVPHGFSKAEEKGVRGFVRGAPATIGPVQDSRERKMETWVTGLLQDLEARAILPAGASAMKTVIKTFPMLPDNPKVFVENFIDVNTLKIMHPNVLKARASGLISYYRGGGDELMPRITRNEIARIEMSEFAFQEYSKARLKELDMEAPAPAPGTEAKKGRKGMTLAEMDLYTQATKSQQTGFLALSRAACNWVFPTEVPRPSLSAIDQKKALGLDQGRIIAADLAVDMDADLEQAEPVLEEAVGPVTIADEAPVVEVVADPKITGIITGLMSGLEAKGDVYLNTDLDTYSRKYKVMIDNIRQSPGPTLVYSNFKTLEGLGIFAAALRASPERFLPLDIVQVNGEWEIPAALMVPGPKYILYTGDQKLDKRRLLLQLYNADVRGLPTKLAEQCKTLLAGADDTRDGRVCRIFMITQSGAEGISLFNTRQVHIMEPYWNNVRLQQVIGRAIRLCSHMNLVWEERTVEIFTYLSVFSEKQKAEGAKQLMMSDKGMTTDEIIFDIASKKQVLANGLMEIAQTAAIDCELHYHEHGATTQCFKFAEKGRPMFMYHPDWHKDIQGSTVRGT